MRGDVLDYTSLCPDVFIKIHSKLRGTYQNVVCRLLETQIDSSLSLKKTFPNKLACKDCFSSSRVYCKKITRIFYKAAVNKFVQSRNPSFYSNEWGSHNLS